MDDASPQLEYAPRPPALRSARARRMAVALGALLLALAITWVTPRAARRLQFQYYMRQCLNHSAAPDQVVFESPTTNAPVIPLAYQKLYPSQSAGTVFLHERVTPQGERRLVAVDLFKGRSNSRDFMGFNALVLDPRGRGSSAKPTRMTSDAGIALIEGRAVRVFAGQADPNNPSHFTIDYVIDDARHTLDGWLKEDGLVALESRD